MNENEKCRCAFCHEEHDPDDLTLTADGDMVCEDCLMENYVRCEYCDEWVRDSEAVQVDHEWWCESCAERHAYICDDCGRYFMDENGYHDDEGQHVCGDCYSERWYICEDCGRLIRDDDVHTFGDIYLCWDCYNDRFDDDTAAIHDYGYKPNPEFAYRNGENPGHCLTFGVELEVDKGDSPRLTAEAVTDAAEGRVYCKRDGSLSDGFEIVSHPASLNYHLYQMRWAKLMKLCREDGFRSHDTTTCGLHIHVGRSGLASGANTDTVAVGNLVLLAHALKNELVTFSRREYSQLAHWARFPQLDLLGIEDDDMLTHAAIRTRDGGRYQAVNLQNDATVELRIFRGTLKRDTLAASLQLVSNLCRYAMEHTPTECLNATYADIVAVHPWDELVTYSRGKSLLAPDPVAIPA